MNDKVLIAIASALSAGGGLVVGLLVRQPEINRLQKQVEELQADVDQLETIAEEQNHEIAQMLLNYKALKIYQFTQRRQLKESIQDELICQYAALDYLTLLVDSVEPGSKMSADNIRFYKTYGKAIEDGEIDDNELEALKPFVLANHSSEIDRLKECDIRPVFERIRYCGTEEEGSKFKGLFQRKK